VGHLLADLHRIDGVHGREVAVAHEAGREEERAPIPGLLVQRHRAEAHVVAQAAAVTRQRLTLIALADQLQVGQVGALDEVHRLLHEELVLRDAVGVEAVAGRGDPADDEALRVRVLAAEDRAGLGAEALDGQVVEVVRGEDEVLLGAEQVLRVAPVAAREGSQLAALGEGRQARQDRPVVALGGVEGVAW
jgi:hypothetical protein